MSKIYAWTHGVLAHADIHLITVLHTYQPLYLPTLKHFKVWMEKFAAWIQKVSTHWHVIRRAWKKVARLVTLCWITGIDNVNHTGCELFAFLLLLAFDCHVLDFNNSEMIVLCPNSMKCIRSPGLECDCRNRAHLSHTSCVKGRILWKSIFKRTSTQFEQWHKNYYQDLTLLAMGVLWHHSKLTHIPNLNEWKHILARKFARNDQKLVDWLQQEKEKSMLFMSCDGLWAWTRIHWTLVGKGWSLALLEIVESTCFAEFTNLCMCMAQAWRFLDCHTALWLNIRRFVFSRAQNLHSYNI